MKQRFTINHKGLTIFGCALAVILFIASCIITGPEPEPLSDMTTNNALQKQYIELHYN